MNLQQLICHARSVYGRRNSVYFRGTPDRIGFLLIAIGDLQDAIRKHRPKREIAHMLARVLSRILCVIDAYKYLRLPEIMCRKYPLTYCTYCGKLPCKCSERRPDYKLSDSASLIQLEWKLKDWCLAFNRMYGPKNMKAGVDTLMVRLFKEVTELQALASRPETIRGDLRAAEHEIALEVADILAWTIAVANHFKADLEAAYIRTYGKGCPRCKNMECTCGPFRYGQLDWGRYICIAATKPA